MKRFMRRVVTVAILSFLAIDHADGAGTIIVAGDTNIINGLDGLYTIPPYTIPIDPGNQQFFTNALAGGNLALVQGPVGTGQTGWVSVDSAALQVNDFFASEGVSSSIVSGPLTGSALAGASLFVKILPTAPSSSDEILVLKNFLSGGGTVFFVGENGNNFNAYNTTINADLSALGSVLRINGDFYVDDNTYWTQITGSHIASDPLTLGISSFSYGVPASISGGIPLFFTQNAQKPFVAYESVPEPSTLALLGGGAIGLLGFIWRRRRRGD